MLAAAYVSCTVPANYICALLIDRLGRVRLMVIGLVGCMLALMLEAIMSALYGGTDNTAGLKAGVFFLFLYVFMYVVAFHAQTFPKVALTRTLLQLRMLSGCYKLRLLRRDLPYPYPAARHGFLHRHLVPDDHSLLERRGDRICQHWMEVLLSLYLFDCS